MDDKESRERLSKLKPEEAYKDTLFNELTKQSHEFQEGLNCMFYDDNATVRELVKKYGIF